MFGDLLHVQERVPPEHAEHREGRPLDRVEVTERVAEDRGADLPPRRSDADRDPDDEGQMEAERSAREILRLHADILTGDI